MLEFYMGLDRIVIYRRSMLTTGGSLWNMRDKAALRCKRYIHSRVFSKTQLNIVKYDLFPFFFLDIFTILELLNCKVLMLQNDMHVYLGLFLLLVMRKDLDTLLGPVSFRSRIA